MSYRIKIVFPLVFCCLSLVETVFAYSAKEWFEKGNVFKNEGAYQYLQESIDQFPNQEVLLSNLNQIGFYRTKYLNMFNGIVSVHLGYKI